MTLAHLTKQRQELVAKIALLEKSYAESRDALAFELSECDRTKEMILLGVDMTKIELGEHVLSIQVTGPLAGEDTYVIDAVLSELATSGGEALFRSYLGTKNYSGWSHQACHWMEYGMGPKHGTIVFRIAISRPLKESPRALTADEIEAAMYLLEMLKAGKWKARATP